MTDPEFVRQVVLELLRRGYTSVAELGPAPCEVAVFHNDRTYLFMASDDGATAPAVAHDSDGPFETGPVVEALESYMPEEDDTPSAIADRIVAAITAASKESTDGPS